MSNSIEQNKKENDLETSDNATSPVPCDAPVDSSNSIEQVLEDALFGLESAKAIIYDTNAMQIETADKGAMIDCYKNLIEAIVKVRKFQTKS